MSTHPVQWELKKKLRARKMPLKELATATGYDDVYLSKVLNGHILSLPALKQIRIALT